LNAFRVVKWLVFGGIFAIIGLFIVAQFLLAPKPAAQVEAAPTRRPKHGFMKEAPSPTPKVLTQKEESQLFDQTSRWTTRTSGSAEAACFPFSTGENPASP
jgi:hypothetical protein